MKQREHFIINPRLMCARTYSLQDKHNARAVLILTYPIAIMHEFVSPKRIFHVLIPWLVMLAYRFYRMSKNAVDKF